MTILKITDLSKMYSNGRGVKDINLSIKGGEIYGFLGPNGSGKTTTLKLIVSIINANSGKIEIDGFDITENFEDAIKNVGAMFESTIHYGDLTALQNLKQVARYYPDINPDRLHEILHMVGLGNYMNEKVKGFSLGMRQRLSIAQAMYAKPKLLILDEPFNGLDIEGIIEIRNIINKMAREDNTAFLISSHMASEMEKMCTHIATIKDGKLLNCDSADNILNLYPSLEEYFISQVHTEEVR